MKKNEVLNILSQTQDNNVLIKKISDDDYISKFIISVLDEHTDEDGNVNLKEVNDYLGYAYRELEKAKRSTYNLLISDNIIWLLVQYWL